MRKACSLLLLALVASCYGFDPKDYTDSKQVLPAYTVYWRVDGDDLYLALNVQTLGWVGFGIAEYSSGSMPGADIVIGSVVDGVGSIDDRWSSAFALPAIDDCQDWILVAASEVDGYTTIEVKRPLDTKDAQDRVVTSGPNRIIVAFGETDTVSYHSVNRETSEITFFGGIPPPPLPDNVHYVDLLMDNLYVPDGETHYACIAFSLPADQKYHIIQMDPIIEASNIHHVHHFLANIVYNTTDGPVYKYPTGKLCDPTEAGSTGLIAGWAMGGGSMYFPEEAGLPIGVDGTQFVLLQIHYNNPGGQGGYYDHSGLRLWYTSELRKYDAAILSLGDPFIAMSKWKVIPPGKINEFETECPSECTAKFPYDIKMFVSSPHMHQTGYSFWTTQWRDGEKIAEFGRVEFWDFDHQSIADINITVKPGDRLNTHCAFDTRNLTTDTYFGPASYNEMCIHFVGYYPRITAPIQFDYCGFATPNYTVCGTYDRTKLLQYNNPTLPDPPGGIDRTFGIANESLCPTPSTPTSSPVITPTLFPTTPTDSPTSAPPTTSQPTATPPISPTPNPKKKSDAARPLGSLILVIVCLAVAVLFLL